jgi:hypothetical protein
MEKIIKISAVLETADHDGSCSGEECDYDSQKVDAYCKMITAHENKPLGKILNQNEQFWEQYLPVPDINMRSDLNYHNPSCYCSPPKGHEDMGVHDYRYIITNIEIIENDKNYILSDKLIDENEVEMMPKYVNNNKYFNDDINMLDKKVVRRLQKHWKTYTKLEKQKKYMIDARRYEMREIYKKYYDFKIKTINSNIDFITDEYENFLIENDIDINERDYDENVYNLVHGIK